MMKTAAILIAFVFTLLSQAVLAAPAGFTLQGRLVKNDVPVTGSVALTVQVVSPNADVCLLYEETHNVTIAADAGGTFSVKIGGGTRTAHDKGLSLINVFSNRASTITSLNCSGSGATSYTPSPSDTRYVYVSFVNGVDTVSFNTPYIVQSVPYALEAERLDGRTSTEYLQTTTDTTQAKLNTIMAPTAYTELSALISGSSTKYLKSSSTAGTTIPSVTTAPTSPTAGQIWFDSTASLIKYYDGTTVQTVGAGGGVAGAASGDVSGTYPTLTVEKIKGQAISTAATISGQVLRYVGATNSWTPSFVSMFDLRSTVTGTSAFSGVGCTAGQTLTWTAATDNLACTDISIPFSSITGGLNLATQVSGTLNLATQVSGALPIANGGTGTTSLPTTFAMNGGQAGALAVGTSDASNVTIKTNNSTRMTVSSDGSIGIGTTSPSEAVEIVGNAKFVGQGVATMTTLGAGISASDTSMTVASTSGYPDKGTLVIDAEAINYTSKTGTTFDGLTRAFYGTTAATHSSGATVNVYVQTLMPYSASTSPIFQAMTNGSVGIGLGNSVLRYNVAGTSYVLGAGNTLSNSGIIVGRSSTISSGGTNGLALGHNATVSGAYANAMGNGSVASAAYSTTIGTFNKAVGTETAASWNGNDPLFTVGNGTSSGSRSNAMMIFQNGMTLLGGGTTVAIPISSAVTVMGSTTDSTRPALNVTDSAGSSKFFVRNDGNIGIGNTSPAAPLDIVRTDTTTSGTTYSMKITPTYNQASATTANTDILINRTETSVGSGAQNFIEGQVAGVQKFKISNAGAMFLQSSASISGSIAVTGNINMSGNLSAGSGGWSLGSTLSYTGGNTSGNTVTLQNNSLTSGIGLYVNSNNTALTGQLLNVTYSGTGSGRPVVISNSNASASGDTVSISSNGTGNALKITTTGGVVTSINSSGNMGIAVTPSYRLDVAGDINTSTCFRIGATTVSGTCTSDARLKEDIHDYNAGLSDLLNVRLRTYKFNGLGEMPKTGEVAVGVIAQELEKTNPELVKTRMVRMHASDSEKTEIKVVDYSKFSYMLINAVKELYQKWFDDHQELEALKQENAAMKAYLCEKDPKASFCH